MSTDKEQATRLADALRNWNKHQPSPLLHEADSLLRRWPDAGEPVAYQYLFDGYNGPVWRSDSGPWNGMQPKASRPLYAAPPAESERIAALEAALADAYAEGRKDEREEWTAEFKPSGWGCTCAGPDGPCESCEANRAAYEEWLAERPWHARIAALEAALKVAGEALEHLNNVYSGDSELIITALRAIEEVRK